MRNDHTFEFTADVIAEAARAKVDYHLERLEHWTNVFDEARDKVEATISAKLSTVPVTDGHEIRATVEYGDPEAWSNLTLAERKIRRHNEAVRDYRSDAVTYGTQGTRPYELALDDIRYFGLNTEEA